MAINQHDNDKGDRQATVQWAAVFSDQVWSNPRLHGQVQFLADSKLKFTANNAITGQQNPNESWYDPGGVVHVSVPQQKSAKIREFSLLQNYPNPFNPTTTIDYSIESTCYARLTVYDMLGRQIITLVDEKKQPGCANAVFDGSDFASGIYFYRLETGSLNEMRKMVMMK